MKRFEGSFLLLSRWPCLLAPLVLALACGGGTETPAAGDPAGTPAPPPGAGSSGNTNPEPPGTNTPTPPAAAACPAVANPVKAGTITEALINEASGLATSRRAKDVLWANNDSGDSARIFALKTDGSFIATVNVVGATAIDWEAMASAPANGGTGDPSLFIADIGDNDRVRKKGITIYVVPEPTLDPTPPKSVQVSRAINLTYDDGPHNAEALLVDPIMGSIVIVTKEENGASGVYLADEAKGTLHRESTLAFAKAPLGKDPLVTDGAVAQDGSMIALRTYSSAFLWQRAAGTSIVDALKGTSCPAVVAQEIQGETITFAADLGSYFTTSEMTKQPLWSFPITKK